MGDKVKLTVNILDTEYEALKRLADEKGISLTDALRRSINLTNQLYDETEHKHKLLLEDEKGAVKQVLLP